MTFDTARGLRLEHVRRVAAGATLMAGSKLRVARFCCLCGVATHAEVGGLRTRTMDRMALRTIHVRFYPSGLVLLHDALVAGGAVIAMSAIGWIGSMWLVTQPASVNVAMHDGRGDRLGFGRGIFLSGSERLAAMTGGATGGAGIAGAPFLDELMARQASHLSHAMLMHGHLVVTLGAGQRIDCRAMLRKHMALVARQVGTSGNVVLVTDRLGGLRILALIEVAGLTAA